MAVVLLTRNVPSRAAKPRTKPMLVIFEPRALPNARLPLLSSAAIAETNISGAEVPKPIITTPTIKVDNPSLLARTEALSTKKSALHMSNNKPAMISAIGISSSSIICVYESTILFGAIVCCFRLKKAMITTQVIMTQSVDFLFKLPLSL